MEPLQQLPLYTTVPASSLLSPGHAQILRKGRLWALLRGGGYLGNSPSGVGYCHGSGGIRTLVFPG